jgi:OOP family OmpA-OmpF porin
MLKLAGKLVFTFVCLGFALSASAFAENRVGAVTLTPMAGYHIFDGGLDLDNNASFGLALGYNITPEWGIEADVRYTPTETDSSDSVDVDVWTFGVSALYHFQPAEALNPYLAIGLGGIVYDLSGTSHNNEDYMGYWGGGLKYAMTEDTALRLDLRHILDLDDDSSLSGRDTTIRSHLSAMLGVVFQFGGASARPVIEKREAVPVVK